ncbi:MAG: SLC13 family permease [Holophagales bacterium]|nr:SLC13 family permease [Holophagales bacterium]
MAGSLILIALLAFLLVASALEWMAVEVAALTVLAALLATGQLSVAEATAGFSDTAVLTVLLMMILSEAVADSGAIAQVGHRIARLARGSFPAAAALVLVVAGVSSMFINNTAAVAIFIPVVIQLAKQHRSSPSRLLLPLNYAAIFGGTCTLIGTSTNLLVSSLADGRGLRPFSMFELFPLGIVFFASGLAYNAWLIRRLPDRGDPANLTGKYQLTPYLTELRVPDGSRLIGRTVVEVRVADRYRLTVLEILRGPRRIAYDLRSTPIQPDDILIVRGTMEDIVLFKEQQVLLLLSDVALSDGDLAGADTTLVEVQLSPASTLEGMSLREIDFRRRFGAFVLALGRTGEAIREQLSRVSLKRFDTLLLLGPRRAIEQLFRMDDFLPLQEVDLRLRLHPRWWLYTTVLAGVVLATALGGVSLLAAALLGTVVLLATRAVRIQRVYRSVNWSIFFLLAASIPIGTAFEKSGLAASLGARVAEIGAGYGPWLALSLTYLATMVLTEILSNASTAVLMVPVALSTAAALGVDTRPFLMAVTFAASNGFVTPIGYQTNAMVYGAGNYRYADFLRAGLPLNLIFWAIASFLIPLLWPFAG